MIVKINELWYSIVCVKINNLGINIIKFFLVRVLIFIIVEERFCESFCILEIVDIVRFFVDDEIYEIVFV